MGTASAPGVTAGLETAVAAWILRGRESPREGAVRAVFKRNAPAQRLEITYTLDAGKAAMDAGGGRVLQLTVRGGEAEAGNPAAWTCDCPAGRERTCLHAALAARGLSEEVDAEAAGEDEAPDPTFAVALEVSSGLATAAERSRASIERAGEGLRVLEATVTLTEQGLACDCPMGAAPACLHRVLVDAWARGARPARVSAGATGALTRGVVARTAEALPEERARQGEQLSPEDVARFAPVLERADELIAELLTYGLQRMTKATLERVDMLVLQARGLGVRDGAPRNAGLGRLVRALEALRQVLGEFLDRKVTTTEVDVLRALGVVRNLGRAVRANTGALPLIEFAGPTQQEYEPVPVLDVQGLGFETWVTATGFAGVTAYVADCRTGRIYTRTNTLPVEQTEQFASRGWRSTSWADQLAAQPAFGGRSESYLDLARSRFLLSGALVAPDSGRLSGSTKTQLAKRPALPLDDPKLRACALLGKADAVRIARRLGFDPLGRPPPSPPVALIPVEAISETHFDPSSQELTLAVRSTSGAVLPCTLTWRESIDVWVQNLERLARAVTPPRALLARIRLDSGGFSIEPLTAWFDKGPPQHLTYKPLDVPVRGASQVIPVELKPAEVKP